MEKYWYQVNSDGFGYPRESGDNYTKLFCFDGNLYAYTEKRAFLMENVVQKKWKEVFVPPHGRIIPLGSSLYCTGSDGIYVLNAGKEFNSTNWKKIASYGIPPGTIPNPRVIFHNEIYASVKYESGAGIKRYGIWRSSDLNTATMNWEKVVDNSFGDPVNNQGITLLDVFDGKLIAGTDTLKALNFGDPAGYTSGGVEIWQSSSGDPGTWAQVNEDGWGTEITVVTTKQKLRTNQIIGSHVTYKGPNQAQEYLYMGSDSHYGAEIWRYDGKGKTGWKNVTPPWAGLDPAFANPGRNEAMIVFDGHLYLAEGYNTGNIAKFDGVNWSVVVNGPNPFDPENGGISDVLVFDNHLIAVTMHTPYAGATKGDQVYGYPFLVWKHAGETDTVIDRSKNTLRPFK